jgi:hypothetical protein
LGKDKRLGRMNETIVAIILLLAFWFWLHLHAFVGKCSLFLGWSKSMRFL